MQKTALTFIIPVCHPDNASDWMELKAYLVETIRSISRQSCSDWEAIIVANTGSDLPVLPDGFQVKYVDFPPNEKFNKAENIEEFYKAIRFDKGRRVQAGLQEKPYSQYYMTVDCDDFVNRDLVDYVSKNLGENGWYIKNGYIWGVGTNLIYRYRDFSRLCGTSLIVRADLYDPMNDDRHYIEATFGSHVLIQDRLQREKTPLAALPFYGAAYRVGHTGAHSKSSSLVKKVLFEKKVLINPFLFFWRLFRFRPLTKTTIHNFGIGLDA